MTDQRLFLLDAYALIYRAYYALIRAPRITSRGFNTSAVFGFCNTLTEILRKENPSHIAVCFDPAGGRTFRHEAYPEYKAQRDKQPEDITNSIPYIKRLLKAMRIPAIEVEGFEADDVIGTLSRKAQAQGLTTYMMTPDKDYCQLVTDHVLMYRPALRGDGFEIRGPQQVCERYGISSPSQVIDLLALEGDASDNVPGCPGVGEKTAAKLIAEFGSVENLLAHTDRLKGALQRKVIDNADQIRQSKWLVTIRTDVPLPEDVTVKSLLRQPENIEELSGLYRELEFRTLLKRLGSTDVMIDKTSAPLSHESTPRYDTPSLFDVFDSQPEDVNSVLAHSIADTPHEYVVASTPAQVAQCVDELAAAHAVGLAVDADSSDVMTANIRAVAFSMRKGHAVVIPVDNHSVGTVMELLQPLFASANCTIASHSLKRDLLLLRRHNIYTPVSYFDTSVAHYVVDPEVKHDIAKLSLGYLDYDMMPQPQAKRNRQIAPSSDQTEWLGELADVTLQLMPVLRAQAVKMGVERLLDTIELPLIPVLAQMEWSGVSIDVPALNALSVEYTVRLHDMEQRTYQLAGKSFNLASPMQVGEILFGQMNIDPKAKRTKTGAYSTTEDILEKYRNQYEIVDLILRIRALRKLLATYIDALPAMVDKHTGKIHTSYNQTVTATGRISSTDPNLQNIPIRTDDGRGIRRAFIPSEGHLLMAADYSQIELRLMAHMSTDADMIDAFVNGADIHRSTAAKIYHTTLEQVTDTQRRNAKTANFGIIYGISAFGLSERLGISRGEAKELIDGYFNTYPGVKAYMERSIEHAREQGCVSTLFQRKRMLPDINSRSAVVRGYAERNAINAPLQGTAADIIKIAMIEIAIDIERRGLESRMIMQVHDELVFDVVPKELDELRTLVVRHMQDAFSGLVPLEVSVGVGGNWLEAH